MTHLILEFCTVFEGLTDLKRTGMLLQFKHRAQQCNFKSPVSSEIFGVFHSTSDFILEKSKKIRQNFLNFNSLI